MKKLGLTIAAITCVYGSAYGKMETYIGLQGGYTISANKGKDTIFDAPDLYTAKSSFKGNHGTLGLFAEIHNDIGGTSFFYGAGLSADGHFGHKPKDLEFVDANGVAFDGGQATAQPSKTTYKSRWSVEPYLLAGYETCHTKTKFFMTVGMPITQFNISPHSGYTDVIPFEGFKRTSTGFRTSFNVRQEMGRFFGQLSVGCSVYKKIERTIDNDAVQGGVAAGDIKYYANTQPRSVDMKLAVGMKI